MLSIQGLTAAYGKNTVLRDVSVTLKPHTITAVLGRNGCGKSTLVSCLSQQLPYTGTISYGGSDLKLLSPRERARTVAILPQILTIPGIRVEELVMFGRNPYLDLGRRPTSADKAAVEQAMTDVGISDWRDKLVSRLSGGQRQRAYLAMILAQETRLLVLDEPTTYMDAENEAAFLETLTRLKTQRKKTILVVLHDLAQALRIADRILVLDGGKAVFDGNSEDCLESGVLERVFHVEPHIFEDRGQRYVVFTPKK